MRVLQGSIGRKGASIVRLIFIQQVNMILVVYIHFSLMLDKILRIFQNVGYNAQYTNWSIIAIICSVIFRE